MRNDSTAASLIAFFLAKYDMDAVRYLGYKNRTDAFKKTAAAIGFKWTYIKLRRDEFDAFFPDASRQGWNKREPKPAVTEFFNEFNTLTFDELGKKIKGLL